MTIEETFQKLIRDKYMKLLSSVQEKAKDHRIYPESIRDYYEDYSQALQDALNALCGKEAAETFKTYCNDLETALVNEAEFQAKQYELRSARANLNKLTKAWNGLDELLTVINNDDLLWLDSKSDFAWSTLVDNFEIFEDALCKMQKKYGLYVPVSEPEKVSPDESVQEKKRRGRPRKEK